MTVNNKKIYHRFIDFAMRIKIFEEKLFIQFIRVGEKKLWLDWFFKWFNCLSITGISWKFIYKMSSENDECVYVYSNILFWQINKTKYIFT